MSSTCQREAVPSVDVLLWFLFTCGGVAHEILLWFVDFGADGQLLNCNNQRLFSDLKFNSVASPCV